MKISKARKKRKTRTDRDLGKIKKEVNFLVVTVHGSGVVCVMVHARPSEQFEGREGGLISINTYKKQ